MPDSILRFEDYHIAWIAPLPIEALAAEYMLDHRHSGHFPVNPGDDYVYSAGDICGRNVIIATLPPGQDYGVGAAGALANHVKKSCPNLWFGLLVGVAAGLPDLSRTPPRDIRLGDVLVGYGDGSSTGLVRYGLGKETDQGFELLHHGWTAKTEAVVRAAIGRVQHNALHAERETFPAHYLAIKDKRHPSGTFIDPGQDRDKLYERITKGEIGPVVEVERTQRNASERTRAWYGRIGSGDKLMKSAEMRDELRDKYDLIGLETEAAGLAETISVGIIRGVCDYGDGQKTKEWQPYAAAMAAAYVKELLSVIPGQAVEPKIAHNDFHVPFNLEGMPYTGQFVERDKEIKEIEDSLGIENPITRKRIHILYGLGGIGKTQLAIAYARKHQDSYSAILWLNGDTKDTLFQSLAAFAKYTRLDHLPASTTVTTHQIKDIEGEAQAVLRWLALPNNRGWLMIVDNADRHHRQKDPQSFDLSSILPSTDHGCVLITSRLQSLDNRWPSTEIQGLGEAQALDLLSYRSGLLQTTQGAKELVERLGYLPLAIVHAGTFIKKKGISCNKYLEIYTSRWSQLVEKLPQLSDYKNGSIHTTWTISYERVKDENETAAKLLQLWANLNRQEIWYDLFRRGSRGCPDCPWLQELAQDDLSFIDIVEPLLEYSLVESRPATGSYSIHPVVHDWCTEMISRDNTDLVILALVIVGFAVPIDTEPEFWFLQRRLVPHADRCTHQLYKLDHAVATQNSQCNKAFHNLGTIYMNQGELTKAEKMYQQALSENEKAWGPEHTSRLVIINNLGILYNDQGKLTEAEKMYQRALSGKEKAWGPEHTSTLDTVNNLGALYLKQGKLAEAEKMCQRALSGKEKAWGPEHTSTLNTVNNLGALYWKQGKLAEAEEMYERTLNGYQKLRGPDHPSTKMIRSNLNRLRKSA